MLIRPYSPMDYDRVMYLNRECHAVPSPDSLLLNKIREGKCWVCEDVSQDRIDIVGFLVSIMKANSPYIYNVAVGSDWRGRGYGSALISHFCNMYLGRATWLQVDVNNPAQMLYFKMGYRVFDICRDFYGTNKHALSMKRPAFVNQ